ncbi:MAG: RNA polymerase sigma factor [Flavobacteriales bacterium]|nr:RNA polymerase sigma factor [Flavobacteriales bacterium]
MNLVLDQRSSTYHVSEEEQYSEQVLIEQAKTDRAAFRPIYEKYYEDIFRFVLKRVSTTDLCQDLVSQTFLKALNKLNDYQFKGVPFVSWLYRIALNEVNLHYRSSHTKRTLRFDTSDLVRMFGEQHEDVVDDEKQERIQRILNALQKLKPEDIQFIQLRFFEDRPYKEVGEIMGTTENNAKVKVFRIVERIKKIMKLN